MDAKPFRFLKTEEFKKLSLDEKISYLGRALEVLMAERRRRRALTKRARQRDPDRQQ